LERSVVGDVLADASSPPPRSRMTVVTRSKPLDTVFDRPSSA
jgi:hypothetical protein